MRIKSEDDILDPAIRKQIIQEIEAGENQSRKDEAYKRHEVWKDGTKRYVIENLLKFLHKKTVAKMEYALSNISVVRKIVGKLARVYAHGVDRSFEGEQDTKKLEKLSKKLKANNQKKTLNRYLKLQRNTVLYIKPVAFQDAQGNTKWRPSWIPMAPYLYDVVEENNDRTKPMVYILSNYERKTASSSQVAADDGTSVPHRPNGVSLFPGNRKDELIADNKEDEGAGSKKQYIWWTDKYHFTTIGNTVVDPNTGDALAAQEGDALAKEAPNPIEIKPFIDLHIDQEGHYWAEGGSDLVDGGILINSLLTNMHHIGVSQGYGQLVLTGPNIPQTIELGPDTSLNLHQTSEDEPAPTAAYITASPPLEGLAKQVEMYLALLLTTNDLSTSGVSASLQGGVLAPSGIALALDKAESLEDVKDQRDIFMESEVLAWKVTAKWLQHWAQENELDEEYKDLLIPIDKEPTIEFRDAQIIMSDTEKVTSLKARKDLGLNTMLELIQKDRGITEDEARKVLKEILKEKIQRQMEAMSNGLPQPGQEVDEEGNPIRPQEKPEETGGGAQRQVAGSKMEKEKTGVKSGNLLKEREETKNK